MDVQSIKPPLIRSFDALRSRSLFASGDCEQLLTENDLANIGQVNEYDADQSEFSQRHAGRCVWRINLNRGHKPPVVAYVKKQDGARRYWPRSTDIKSGQVLQTYPIREWNGLLRLQAAGILTAQPMALFHRGWLHVSSAIITEAVPPAHSIDELLHQNKVTQWSGEEWQGLLDKVMDTTIQIYESGLAWKGSSTRHFYPELQSDGSWKVWLIDCEGVHYNVSPKVALREHDKLIRSFAESKANNDTLEYLEKGLARRRETFFANKSL